MTADPRPLAPAEIDALRGRHVPDPEEDDPEFWWCAACSSFNDGPEGWAIFVDWPCDAANLLATLDAMAAFDRGRHVIIERTKTPSVASREGAGGSKRSGEA